MSPLPRHREAMAERLHPLYRQGPLVEGVLGAPAVELERLDEDGLAVQRAHWFDATLDVGEAAMLAAVLGIEREPWMDLAALRAWVHAIRDVRLRWGATTRMATIHFVSEYVGRYQEFTALTALPSVAAADWIDSPSDSRPALVENPTRWRVERAPSDDGISPLARFSVSNGGLDETNPSFLLVGLPGEPEVAPAIVNVTTGQALLFQGSVRTGQRLWLRPRDDGSMSAYVERDDRSGELRSLEGVVPGEEWQPERLESPARAMTLAPGDNTLFFVTLGVYDLHGLDRFVFAVPGLEREPARFDETGYDSAAFHQEARLTLHLGWKESRPAAFEVHVPAGVLRSKAGALAEALAVRQNVELAVRRGLDIIRPAGVQAAARLRILSEVQPQGDGLRIVAPLHLREMGATGADSLPDRAGGYGSTDFDESTFG